MTEIRKGIIVLVIPNVSARKTEDVRLTLLVVDVSVAGSTRFDEANNKNSISRVSQRKRNGRASLLKRC